MGRRSRLTDYSSKDHSGKTAGGYHKAPTFKAQRNPVMASFTRLLTERLLTKRAIALTHAWVGCEVAVQPAAATG